MFKLNMRDKNYRSMKPSKLPTCSTLQSLSTWRWKTFMQSSARCSWVAYLLSSFWYCGIAFTIWDKSRRLAFWLDVIRLASANCFSCLVTCLKCLCVVIWAYVKGNATVYKCFDVISMASANFSYLVTPCFV